jgi:hypothetical protein
MDAAFLKTLFISLRESDSGNHKVSLLQARISSAELSLLRQIDDDEVEKWQEFIDSSRAELEEAEAAAATFRSPFISQEEQHIIANAGMPVFAQLTKEELYQLLSWRYTTPGGENDKRQDGKDTMWRMAHITLRRREGDMRW